MQKSLQNGCAPHPLSTKHSNFLCICPYVFLLCTCAQACLYSWCVSVCVYVCSPCLLVHTGAHTFLLCICAQCCWCVCHACSLCACARVSLCTWLHLPFILSALCPPDQPVLQGKMMEVWPSRSLCSGLQGHGGHLLDPLQSAGAGGGWEPLRSRHLLWNECQVQPQGK